MLKSAEIIVSGAPMLLICLTWLSTIFIAVLFFRASKLFKRERRKFKRFPKILIYLFELSFGLNLRSPKAIFLRFIIFMYCFQNLILMTIHSSILTTNMISPRFQKPITLDMVAKQRYPFGILDSIIPTIKLLNGTFHGIQESTILSNYYICDYPRRCLDRIAFSR